MLPMQGAVAAELGSHMTCSMDKIVLLLRKKKEIRSAMSTKFVDVGGLKVVIYQHHKNCPKRNRET